MHLEKLNALFIKLSKKKKVNETSTVYIQSTNYREVHRNLIYHGIKVKHRYNLKNNLDITIVIDSTMPCSVFTVCC